MSQHYQVTTIAGNGKKGHKDGTALEAMFSAPNAICCSNDGRLYIYDDNDYRLRMLYNNQVTTIAESSKTCSQNGNSLLPPFFKSTALCCSTDGKIYIAGYFQKTVSMLYNNQITTIAGTGQRGFKDGNALEAMFYHFVAICCSEDDKIYVIDKDCGIRMIHDHQVTTIVEFRETGRDDILTPRFKSPKAICCLTDGRIYVADSSNNEIKKIHNNRVTSIAGSGSRGFKDGNASEAMFNYPTGICCSEDGRIYVADNSNCRIRMIYNNQVTTIAGNGNRGFKDGNALQAMFSYPTFICCSKDGRLYVADELYHRIRMIDNIEHIKSTFGFGFLLDMQNAFCDCQISFNEITYHLHSVFMNVRCPFLLDQSYFTLIQQSNISNESFDSFVTFLYSNKFTKENNQTWPTTMSIKNIVEMIFIFDILMDCKWILIKLKARFLEKLIEMFKIDENQEQQEQQEEAEQSIRNQILELLPCLSNLKELVKTKPIKSKISYTEYCYNTLVEKLQSRRSILTQLIPDLQHHLTYGAFVSFTKDIVSDTNSTEPFEDESMIVFEAELTELCKLAFYKTNISQIENKTEIQSSLSIQYLEKWTNPDFVIKVCNNDMSYHVHKLILCGRWKYFCQMIESGLKEANDNEMTLSEDWTKSRFEKFMKYIYLNEIEFDEMDDVAWLIKNRTLFRITVDKSNNQQDDDQIDTNQSSKIEIDEIEAVSGFEALYEHCIDVLHQPLTLSNCVSLYLMYEDIGVGSLVQEAFEFISENLSLLLKNKTTRNEIESILGDQTRIRLFFSHFEKEEEHMKRS